MMKEKIIRKAVELHQKYGLRNVSMDQIALELGISKKTIYQYFENKTDLVSRTVDYIFNQIQSEINRICRLDLNPYEELFAVKNLIKENLRKSDSSPYYQLKKYYPDIAKSLEKRKFESIMKCLENNLNKGIEQGLYKPGLEKEFIKRMYFVNTLNLSNPELFPPEMFDKEIIMDWFLNMFFHGISTPEGLELLNKTIKKTDR